MISGGSFLVPCTLHVLNNATVAAAIMPGLDQGIYQTVAPFNLLREGASSQLQRLAFPLWLNAWRRKGLFDEETCPGHAPELPASDLQRIADSGLLPASWIKADGRPGPLSYALANALEERQKAMDVDGSSRDFIMFTVFMAQALGSYASAKVDVISCMSDAKKLEDFWKDAAVGEELLDHQLASASLEVKRKLLPGGGLGYSDTSREERRARHVMDAVALCMMNLGPKKALEAISLGLTRILDPSTTLGTPISTNPGSRLSS